MWYTGKQNAKLNHSITLMRCESVFFDSTVLFVLPVGEILALKPVSPKVNRRLRLFFGWR